MIFDCHTHWTDSFESSGRSASSGWIDFLRAQGITHSVVLPMEGLVEDTKIPVDNEEIASACSQSNGRMIPFCTVNPWSGEEAVNEFCRCLEVLKHRGLKIHPWLQGTSVNNSTMDALCEMAAGHDVPLLLHDGTPCFSLPSQIAVLAKRHPATKIVLGHCGLFEHWREAIAAMRFAENLWACLCGPYPAALRQIIRQCDPERLVWGTDFGAGPNALLDYRVHLMDTLGLDDAGRKAIFETNPARLLGDIY